MSDQNQPSEPVSQPVELTPKERTKQAIALCHNLIATSPVPFERHQAVAQALQFLETMFQQVVNGPDQPVTTPVEPEPKPAKKPRKQAPKGDNQ